MMYLEISHSREYDIYCKMEMNEIVEYLETRMGIDMSKEHGKYIFGPRGWIFRILEEKELPKGAVVSSWKP